MEKLEELKIIAENIVKQNRANNDKIISRKEEQKKKIIESDDYKNIAKLRMLRETYLNIEKELDNVAKQCSPEINFLMTYKLPTDKDFITEYLRLKLIKKYNLKTEDFDEVLADVINKLKPLNE